MTTTPDAHPDGVLAAALGGPRIEPLDPARIAPGAVVAIGEGPWGTVAEVFSGGWPSTGIRVWIDYGTHLECYTRRVDAGPDGAARMMLRISTAP